MIISHRHRYLFIEIPLTASWSIRHELVEHYEGEPILHKHASYPEFRRIAGREQLSYCVFATVRNPLDCAVSRYMKYKTNHKGAFSDPETVVDLRAEDLDIRKFEFIQATNASFPTYFKRYHAHMYSDMIELSADRLDSVIRYENLQDGFSKVLLQLGLQQVAPIPMMNQTQDKRRDYTSYYTSDIIDQAKSVFGPFMEKWSYGFPENWGPTTVRPLDRLKFRLLGAAQRLYLTQIRYNQGAMGRFGRAVRAWLSR